MSHQFSQLKFNIEHSIGYQMHQGFMSSHPSQDRDILTKNHITNFYSCLSTIFPGMLDMHLVSPNGAKFDATKFLKMMSNRTIAVLGDSLGCTCYQDIRYEFADFEDKDPKMSFDLYFENRSRAAHVYYKNYNVTLLWCHPNVFVPPETPFYDFCVDNAYRQTADKGVLLYVVGAHYKPKQMIVGKLSDYYLTVQNYVKDFEDHIANGIKVLNDKHPSATRQVIFALNGRKGPLDEYNYMYKNNHSYSHDETNWDLHEREAIWAGMYNDRIRKVCQNTHNCYVWDIYTISKRLIYFVIDRFKEGVGNSVQEYEGKLKVHRDSLHYCSGTVFRQALIMLQDLVELHSKWLHMHKY